MSYFIRHFNDTAVSAAARTLCLGNLLRFEYSTGIPFDGIVARL
jgi:hypothetical protein